MNWRTYLRAWVDENRALWTQYGMEAIVTHPVEPSDTPSIRVDFDSQDYMGRITLWESGECDIEIISVASAATLLWKHYEFDNPQEADKVLLAFAIRLNQPIE